MDVFQRQFGDENAVGKVEVEKATEEVEDDTEEEAQKGRITGSSSFHFNSLAHSLSHHGLL